MKPIARLATLVAALAVLAAFPVLAQDLETGEHSKTGRKSAHILPAERSAILLSPGREDLERPHTTLDKMGLKDGDLVADVGAGNGFYSLRVAERVAPHGAVFAVDVQQGMLDQLQARADEAGIRNIYPILGAFEDPHLPPGKMDWLLLVDVYHEFNNPESMLEKMRAALAPDGRVALLEYRAEQDPATIPFPIPRDHKMTVDEVMSEWIPAGFELVELAEMLPAQHLFIFKAADNTLSPIVVGETSNAARFGDSVYFGGQPNASAFKEYAALGVKTVINLRTPTELAGLGFNEAETVAAAGMAYANHPMGRALLEGEDLDALLNAIAEARQAGPVLIHCASSNRVGAIWAAYRLTRNHLPLELAIAEGKAAGMRAPAFEEAVRTLASTQ